MAVPANLNLADTSFGLWVGIKVVMLYLSGIRVNFRFAHGERTVEFSTDNAEVS